VNPWTGITASDVRVDPGGRISFKVGPRHSYNVGDVSAEIGPIDYPDSYAGRARFIRNQRTVIRDPSAPSDPVKFEWYCFTCTFRPWADTGDVDAAWITILDPRGNKYRMRAKPRSDGRWYVTRKLRPREFAYVQAGDVRDDYGNYNATESAKLSGMGG
jgi:hypothetical protein